MFGLILILVCSTLISARFINDSCQININYKYGDFGAPQPLILTRNNSSVFLYPQHMDRLNVFAMQKIILSCPGKNNYLKGIDNDKKLNSIELICFRRNKFFYNFQEFILNPTNVSCNTFPKHVARRTSSRCYNNNTQIEIGFLITDKNNNQEFIRTIDLCRNDTHHWTYYTHYKLTSKIENLQLGFPRPRQWFGADFYEHNIDNLYKISTQISTLEILLGSKKLVSKFVAVNSTRFLSRGHMVPKSDFVYGNEQRSTFWYVNSAPQWQSFNGGNWNILESSIRKFAVKNGINLEIFTGIHGQMMIEDENNNQVPVYLFGNETHRALEVPRFFWKVIYQPETKKGTAFVGLNDPYQSAITEDMFICKDLSERIKLINWNKKSLSKGVSYACDVNHLRKVIPSIPDFPVEDILI
ncbi:GSCOCG00007281001-RA-CDS [Cotesia congregata]|nr:GSCOCG00007281001-RA-CDS [Cotesia congregata]